MRNFTPRYTANVSLNIALLLASLSVALAVAIEHFAARPTVSSRVHQFIIVLEILTTLYAILTLIWQIFTLRNEPEKTPGLLRSAILSAFILLLVAFLISGNNAQIVWFLVGFGICIILFAITSLSPDETTTSEIDSKRLLPSIELFYPDAEDAPRNGGTNPNNLPPLFINDPLYRLPQPGKRARFFSVAKGNNPLTDSDDACVISPDETRFALCDGASNSRYPHPWGTLLGLSWTQSPCLDADPSSLTKWLKEPRKKWREWVTKTLTEKVNQRNQQLRKAPMSKEDIDRILTIGASSTFLGFALDTTTRPWSWHVMALGTTCLFILQQNKNGGLRSVESLPLEKPAEFGGRPLLLNSVDTNVETVASRFTYQPGQIYEGNIFMMATQPLAQWLLAHAKTDDFFKLLSMRDPDEFDRFVREQRQQKRNPMIDDDTSLVIIQF